MTAEFPLVSIVITSFNRAGLISKSIESALSQDYPNLEIIISDNCSTDNSDFVIRQYLADRRVIYNRNIENIGMLLNFRKAFYELSSGEYVTFISSDDYLTDNTFVSEAMGIAMANPGVGMVFGRMAFENTVNGVVWTMPSAPYFHKQIWNGKEVFFESVNTGLFSWGACLLKRSSMVRVGALLREFNNGDLDINYKIMINEDVGFMDKVCYWQIGHTSNTGFPTIAEKVIKNLECFNSVASYAIEKIPSFEFKIRDWENHFLKYTINLGFHNLYENNKEEFRILRSHVRITYPDIYMQLTESWGYKKMLYLKPFKKYLPRFLRRIV